MALPRIVASRPSLAMYLAPPALFAVWTGLEPRAEDVTSCMAAAIPQARGLGRCATIVVIHPDTPLPGPEVRHAIQAEMRKLDPFVVCGATVVGREDLRGTALRAVASTLQLLTRPTHPERIVGTAEEATAFVQGLLAKASKPGESSPTQDELLVAYEQVTRQVWQTR